MSRRTYLGLTIIGILVLFAAGCTQACDSADYSTINSSVSYFYNTLPTDGAIISDTTPLLAWDMTVDCEPGEYQVNLISEKGIDHSGTSPGNTQHFTSGALAPGTEFFWSTTARSSGGTMAAGPTRETNFYTGPVCTGSSLLPPTPLTPANGVFAYHYPDASFSWDYPDTCLPEYYKFQMATDPGFSNIFLNEFTSSPSKIHRNYYYSDCYSAWWRVAAVSDGVTGPWSSAWKLHFVHSNECWLNHEDSVEFAVIRGTVFEDICPDTMPWLPPDTVLLPGCVYDSEFGIHADGIRSRGAGGESAIPYMSVELGAGACPSTGLDTAYAGSDGNYLLFVQSPGEYCLSVTENYAMDNGLWTEPLMDEETAEVTITVYPGDETIFQHFAWDDWNSTMVEIDFPDNFFCRRGDTILHRPEFMIERGSRYPAIARNDDGSMLLLKIGDIRCFSLNPEDPEKVFELPPYDPSAVPDPLPEPEPDKPKDKDKDDPGPIDPCSRYTNPQDCKAGGCKWPVDLGYCKSY